MDTKIKIDIWYIVVTFVTLSLLQNLYRLSKQYTVIPLFNGFCLVPSHDRVTGPLHRSCLSGPGCRLSPRAAQRASSWPSSKNSDACGATGNSTTTTWSTLARCDLKIW